MPDQTPSPIARPQTDPSIAGNGNREGADGHYSGQEDDAATRSVIDSVAAGADQGGAPTAAGRGAGAGQDGEDLPAEAGHRATVDQRTGAVHGSGAGAGGGRAGEDPDSDSGGSNTG